jgi:hypothetical protein
MAPAWVAQADTIIMSDQNMSSMVSVSTIRFTFKLLRIKPLHVKQTAAVQN